MEIELLAQSTWTLLILIAVADCTIPRWPHPYTCHITCSSTMRHWRFSPQEVGPNFLSLNLHRGFWGLWQLEFSGGKVPWLLRQEGAFHQAHVMLTLGIWPPYYKHKTHRDYRWLSDPTTLTKVSATSWHQLRYMWVKDTLYDSTL